jgi:hypothetical protein
MASLFAIEVSGFIIYRRLFSGKRENRLALNRLFQTGTRKVSYERRPIDRVRPIVSMIFVLTAFFNFSGCK